MLIEQLFSTAPKTWGLRGDPALWYALRDQLGDQAIPDTIETFIQLLHQAYEINTGQAFNNPDLVRVEKFKRQESGISNGIVSPQFWTETGFPHLVERYNSIYKQKRPPND